MTILLDIDGVMIPAAGWKVPKILHDGFPDFNIKAVQSLNKIIANTKAEILLTTSHKFHYSIPEWTAIFNTRGIDSQISTLKDQYDFSTRREEIENWFYSNQREGNFVIIDDDKSLNDLPLIMKDKVVLTSALVGLTDELADKAIEILLHP